MLQGLAYGFLRAILIVLEHQRYAFVCISQPELSVPREPPRQFRAFYVAYQDKGGFGDRNGDRLRFLVVKPDRLLFARCAKER